MNESWLIDKSAFVRLAASRDAEVWADRISRGLVRMCTVTRLEMGFSARSGAHLRESLLNAAMMGMLEEYLTPAAENRALEIQLQLADRGQHRAPSVPDLLLAAVAEMGNLTLLHVDKDFDLIAAITGQPVQRLT